MDPSEAREFAQDPRAAPPELLDMLGLSRSQWKGMRRAERYELLRKWVDPSLGNTLMPGYAPMPTATRNLSSRTPWTEPIMVVPYDPLPIKRQVKRLAEYTEARGGSRRRRGASRKTRRRRN